MAYSRTTWENSPSVATPISADNLNNIEQGILDVESSVNALSGTVGVAMGTAGTAVNISATQGSVTATQGSVAATQGSVSNTQGSVSSHISATTSVHGITDTANLVYTNNATLGSVATINASLGSVAGTVSTNTAAIGSVSGTVTTILNEIVTQQFGTVNANYTIGTADANKLIKTTSATAITITLPPNGSVAFPVGQGIDVVQMAAGTVTFGTAVAGTAGTVTILSTPSLILRTQSSAARVVKTDTNEWLIMGDMF